MTWRVAAEIAGWLLAFAMARLALGAFLDRDDERDDEDAK